MKSSHILSILILSCFSLTSVGYCADLSTDFIENAAFQHSAKDNKPVKSISLFGNKKNKKQKNKVEVEQYGVENEDMQLTDADYIKKLRREDKKGRKRQFNLTVKDESQYSSVGELSTEDDGSAATPDPSDKKFFGKKTRKQRKDTKQEAAYEPSEIILTSDVTDYFPDRNEIEAVGNAKLEIKKDNFTLYADKIVFNHDINSLRAYDNVKIIKEENVTTGDFINIDLNTAHGWVEKPVSSNYSVKIKAEEAYVYPDRIEEYDGVANILEDKRLMFGSSNFTNLLNPGQLDFGDVFMPKPGPSAIAVKAKSINVESKDGHNIITLNQAGVYYKKFKIGTVPTLQIVTDKEQSVMQTNIPEIGSDSNMGMYAGPSVVLNLPLSSILKISPVALYSRDESKFGIGGIATFMSPSNYTEMAYGSAENKFLLRGHQKLTDNLSLRYSQNMYVSQWFMGYRRPMYSLELEYDDNYYIDDLGVNFRHKIQAGYYSDYASIRKFGEGRLRWMTQAQKTLLSYTNNSDTFNAELGLIGQTSVAQYTTGDTFALARIGPRLSTTYKNWNQHLVYYQTATGGKTPFKFDDYYYGKSNLQIIETLRLNKYITLGYLMSIALTGRNSYVDPLKPEQVNKKANDWLQENMFLVSLGPDEAKVTIGYDAFRQSTAVYFSMLLGTKDMNIGFDKASLQNFDTIANENKKIPLLKETFNKVKYKVFPATNPEYRRTDLYGLQPQEVDASTDSENSEEVLDPEMQRQIRQQLNPFVNEQRRMMDNRM